MVRFVLAPGNGPGSIVECMWYPAVARALRRDGHEFVLRDFPDPVYAHESEWLPFMRGELHCGADTVVVGHSSGAAAALRLLEGTPLAGVVLVAAYHTDLGDAMEEASGYFSRPWPWDAIRKNAGFIIQFHSKDDDLVPVKEARFVHEQLHSEYHELNGYGHFQEDTFPELLAAVRARIPPQATSN
eukprot:TRINITY_DN18083_c0_g1_i1.p1 TRINITY_DN18083_c0_g1~~TRINITY_DN18083_c0_g1_i1.p1  ORF type:complete len:186 (+),score=56.62 TRINITY_DN18083_c0_g1_i1:82-639(+)